MGYVSSEYEIKWYHIAVEGGLSHTLGNPSDYPVWVYM